MYSKLSYICECGFETSDVGLQSINENNNGICPACQEMDKFKSNVTSYCSKCHAVYDNNKDAENCCK